MKRTCNRCLHLQHALLMAQDVGSVIDDAQRHILLQPSLLQQVSLQQLHLGPTVFIELLHGEARRRGIRHRYKEEKRGTKTDLTSFSHRKPQIIMITEQTETPTKTNTLYSCSKVRPKPNTQVSVHSMCFGPQNHQPVKYLTKLWCKKVPSGLKLLFLNHSTQLQGLPAGF